MRDPGAYRAPRWLPDGHTQTLYSALLAPTPRVTYRRERWELPDGDFLDADWIDGPDDAPLVALFHGFEGCSRSHYALAVMAAVKAHRWRGVVVHFRGCSGEPNRLLRAYHSGDAAEVDWIVHHLQSLRGPALYAVGISMSGNRLLKWLGEQGEAAAPLLTRAASVSAPVDLASAGDQLARGFNRLYTYNFLSTLKPKTLAKARRFPGAFDLDAVRRAHTLREFDNAFTAPVHGFHDTDDYWTRASARPLLKHVAVPTLLLAARNDPFLTPRCFPARSEVSTHVNLVYPNTGGHVGFVRGAFPGRLDWLAQRLLYFFATGN